jgi:hypothetical protein
MPFYDYGEMWRRGYADGERRQRRRNVFEAGRRAANEGGDAGAAYALERGEFDHFDYLNRYAANIAAGRHFQTQPQAPQAAPQPMPAATPQMPQLPGAAQPNQPMGPERLATPFGVGKSAGQPPTAAPPQLAGAPQPQGSLPDAQKDYSKQQGARRPSGFYGSMNDIPRTNSQGQPWQPGDTILVGLTPDQAQTFMYGQTESGTMGWMPDPSAPFYPAQQTPDAAASAPEGAPSAAGAAPGAATAPPTEYSNFDLGEAAMRLAPPEFVQRRQQLAAARNEYLQRGLLDEAEQLEGMMLQDQETATYLFAGQNQTILQSIPFLRQIRPEQRLQAAIQTLQQSPYAFGPDGQPTPFTQQITQRLQALHQSGGSISDQELDSYERQSMTLAQRIEADALQDERRDRDLSRAGRSPYWTEPSTRDAVILEEASVAYQSGNQAIRRLERAREIIQQIEREGGAGWPAANRVQRTLTDLIGRNSSRLQPLYDQLSATLWPQVLANLEGLAPVTEVELGLALSNTINPDMTVATMYSELDQMIAQARHGVTLADERMRFQSEAGNFAEGRDREGRVWADRLAAAEARYQPPGQSPPPPSSDPGASVQGDPVASDEDPNTIRVQQMVQQEIATWRNQGARAGATNGPRALWQRYGNSPAQRSIILRAFLAANADGTLSNTQFAYATGMSPQTARNRLEREMQGP